MDNLLTYKSLDPDQLYYRFPEGSMTFFYVPSTGNLYMAPYPTNHQDMLVDDDDLFDDVYGDLEWGTRERREWASRGKALTLTDAVLGRIAAVGEDFVVSFWRNPPRNHLKEFLSKLFQKYPTLSRRKDAIIVVAPQTAPYNLAGKPLNPNDTVAQAETPAISKEKKYQIAGNAYSLQDLQNLRAAIHTKSMAYGDPLAILCHQDMAKYPELAGFRPASCGEKGDLRKTHPEKWRQAGKNIDPYLYKYGETFKEFFGKNDG